MLIDSNIIVYALNTASPDNKTAQDFLKENIDELLFTQQNIFETIKVLTHSKFPNLYSPEEAIQAVTTITDHGMLLSPTLETPTIAFDLIKKYNIIGTEVFDAYLVATALSHDIHTIATYNTKHLNKYQEVMVLSPLIK